MKKILVIGGGAMGSAFTIPCLENKNDVTITEPYSKRFIKDLSSKKKFHSALKIKLPSKLKFRKFSSDLLEEKFDLLVIALSLPGIDFIAKKFRHKKIKTKDWRLLSSENFQNYQLEYIANIEYNSLILYPSHYWHSVYIKEDWFTDTDRVTFTGFFETTFSKTKKLGFG